MLILTLNVESVHRPAAFEWLLVLYCLIRCDTTLKTKWLISVNTNRDWEKHRNTFSAGLTHTDLTVYMWIYCTFILTCDRSSPAVLMSQREKRIYNISLLLIYHATQSIMGRISHQVFSGSPTQFHWWSRSNPKPRIERLSECGLDCVDEVHCVRDAVEGQSSCTVIHKHSYSPADGLYREISPYRIVYEWVSGGRADQIPGLIIISKHTLMTRSLPADALIWHWYIHTIISSSQ